MILFYSIIIVIMIQIVKKHENNTIQENKQKRLAKFYKNSKNKPNNIDKPTNQVVTRVYGETSPMPIKPKIIVKNNMILFLRGHIRDSFENNRLYNFISFNHQKCETQNQSESSETSEAKIKKRVVT